MIKEENGKWLYEELEVEGICNLYEFAYDDGFMAGVKSVMENPRVIKSKTMTQKYDGQM